MTYPLPPPQPRSRQVIVDAESEGQRLDVFLSRTFAEYSRARLQKLIEGHNVWVDGKSAKASTRLRGGQSVSILEPPPEPAEPAAQDIALVILFEDADILVLDKPAGMVVHPAPGNPQGTLVNALLHHCTDLSGIGGVLRPGIVHRLDRDTTGVMVVTKNDRAHHAVARQFLEHTVEKSYLAFGLERPGARPLAASGRIETLFGRHPVHRKRFTSRVEVGKRAVTEYQVLRRFETEDWLVLKILARPRSGRTHQIRVHFADGGFPLLGDRLYGGRSMRTLPGPLGMDRQALHAWKLAFTHPTLGKRLEFMTPPPQDLVALEERLVQATLRLTGPGVNPTG